MKNLLSLVTLSLIPFSLLAQPKPTVRKATTTAKRPATSRVTTTPAKKSAPAAKLTATQPASTAPARQEQPAVAYVAPAPKTQPVAAGRPAARLTGRTVVPASAQEARFKVGFRLGVNSSTFGGVDISEAGPGVKLSRVTGFHGGVFFTMGGPQFSVQPEILFTQYGVRVAAGSDYEQYKYNLVEVPVLFKASFGQPSLRFFVNAGPVLTYTMGGTYSVSIGGQSDSQKIPMTNDGRLAFGASGGAGLALKAGPGSVLVEARYSYLFSNKSGVTLHPQNLMLSAGYQIPLGR